ncbi:nuclear transport factor 2 family protein [Leeuwenhoekiella sp. A16]|uniref:nuclear transport factor 2 family protein n=1 Tax=unclassified Leeuwenhoekiella TaxID=2615029 RepID=UPI003A80F78B|tara:strand:- start:67 stop:567 length:501 start_codon:yes stop_codon:yes gene_type:complete
MAFKKSVFILFLAGFSLLAQTDQNKQTIDSQLNAWHKAAADADFDAYFNLMTDDAIFIGTDATENWNVEEFKAFAKPYFDKGKAWSFTAIERNIFIGPSQKIAWFDELLNTQMGICRGSGVLVKVGSSWKIRHYVLSIAIPNDDVDQVTALKKEHDSLLTSKILQN